MVLSVAADQRSKVSRLGVERSGSAGKVLQGDYSSGVEYLHLLIFLISSTNKFYSVLFYISGEIRIFRSSGRLRDSRDL